MTIQRPKKREVGPRFFCSFISAMVNVRTLCLTTFFISDPTATVQDLDEAHMFHVVFVYENRKWAAVNPLFFC